MSLSFQRYTVKVTGYLLFLNSGVFSRLGEDLVEPDSLQGLKVIIIIIKAFR